MIKKWYQSKTVNFNAIYLGLVAIVTKGFGVEPDPVIIAGGMAAMNWVLRRITSTAYIGG